MTVIEFMKNEQINSINSIEDNRDRYHKCDICGKFSETYDCSGYNPKEKEIQYGYEICHECALIIAYGETE